MSWSQLITYQQQIEVQRDQFFIFACFSIKVSINLSVLLTIITSILLLSPMVSKNSFYLAPACVKKINLNWICRYLVIFRHSWRQSCAFPWVMSVFHCCCCSNAPSKASAHRVSEMVQKPFWPQASELLSYISSASWRLSMASGDLEGRKKYGTWSEGHDLGVAPETTQIFVCGRGRTQYMLLVKQDELKTLPKPAFHDITDFWIKHTGYIQHLQANGLKLPKLTEHFVWPELLV